MWSFSPKDFQRELRCAMQAMNIDDAAESLCQNRHGNPSRDTMMMIRSRREIQDRGASAVEGTVRINNKPRRLQQMLSKTELALESYG